MKSRVYKGKEQLYDPVRRKWVVRRPEEHVRQSVVEYLLGSLKVPLGLIAVEFSLSNLVPGNRRLADIVVWRRAGSQELSQLRPWLLVECKAPSVKITPAGGFQVEAYLASVESEYVMITSGKDSRYFQNKDGRYESIQALPRFPAAPC